MIDINGTQTIINEGEQNEQFRTFINSSVLRLLCCDWGDLTEAEAGLNNEVVDTEQGYIHAVYNIPDWCDVDTPEECDNSIWMFVNGYEIGEGVLLMYPSEYERSEIRERIEDSQ